MLAAPSNPRVSDDAREHAREELGHIESQQDAPSGDDRHDANVRRGLKA